MGKHAACTQCRPQCIMNICRGMFHLLGVARLHNKLCMCAKNAGRQPRSWRRGTRAARLCYAMLSLQSTSSRVVRKLRYQHAGPAVLHMRFCTSLTRQRQRRCCRHGCTRSAHTTCRPLLPQSASYGSGVLSSCCTLSIIHTCVLPLLAAGCNTLQVLAVQGRARRCMPLAIG